MKPVDQWRTKAVKEAAEQLGQPEELVDIVTRFQWIQAKKASKTCNQLEFPGLGTFAIRPHELTKMIVKQNIFLNAYKRDQANAVDDAVLATLTKKVETVEETLDNLNFRLAKFEERESKFEKHT